MSKRDKPAEGRHDSGKTSESKESGAGGRHSEKPDGWYLGSRRERPHHPSGWQTDGR